jgi:hypothetical protein
MFTRLFLLILLFIFNSNIGISQSDSLNFKIDLNLGGNVNVGNFTTYNLIFRTDNEFRWKQNEIVFSPKFHYSEILTNGRLSLREREFYVNYGFTKRSDKWRTILFGELEHTFLRKIDLRTSFGVGFGKKIFKNKYFEIDVSEVILPELTISDFGKNYDNFAIRASTRLKFIWEREPFKVSSITIFQPSLYTMRNGGIQVPLIDNISARSLNNFEVSISKPLSFGVGNEVIIQTYSYYLNPTVMPIDWMISFFIKYKI